MASAREMSQSKRPHVKTERMQEFMRAQGDANSPTKKLKCPEPECNKMFTSSPGLKYHLQTHKTENPQFSCKKCFKVFKSANGLKYHRGKTGCDDTDIIYTCPTDTFHVSAEESKAQCGRRVPGHLDLSSISTVTSPVSASRGMDKLTELAIIATSPQSPLLQRPKPPWDCKPSGDVVRSLEKMLNKCENGHQGNRTVEKISMPDSTPDVLVLDLTTDSMSLSGGDGSDPRVSTSSPLCVSPDDSEKLGTSTWSHSWPTAVWQCFISGTKIHFVGSSDGDWKLADSIAQREELTQQAAINYSLPRYAPDGLRVQSISDVTENVSGEIDQSEIKIHCIPKGEDNSSSGLLAVCKKDHPFFVKDKGWSSSNPCDTVMHYGIPCLELCVGDVCLPPSHTDACFSEEIYKSFEEFEFTPEDTSAVFALSSMKHKNDAEASPPPGSGTTNPPGSGHTKSPYKNVTHVKAKRPMNAFLLFAKDFRVNYTQKFPKRDNRLISVMLGEQWKALSTEKRKVYEEQARLLADKQKKMHPDCWKRKK